MSGHWSDLGLVGQRGRHGDVVQRSYGAVMMSEEPELDCPICAKHRGHGPLVGPKVWEDEVLLLSHRPVGADGTSVLG